MSLNSWRLMLVTDELFSTCYKNHSTIMNDAKIYSIIKKKKNEGSLWISINTSINDNFGWWRGWFDVSAVWKAILAILQQRETLSLLNQTCLVFVWNILHNDFVLLSYVQVGDKGLTGVSGGLDVMGEKKRKGNWW